MFLIKLARSMFDKYLNLQKEERGLRKKKNRRLPRLKSLQHLAEVLAASRQDERVGPGERVIKNLEENIQTGFTWATDLQHSEWHLPSLNYPDVGKSQLLLMKGSKYKVYRKRLWPTLVNVRFGWTLTANKIVIHLSKNLQLQGKVFLVSFPPESNRYYWNVYSGFFCNHTI